MRTKHSNTVRHGGRKGSQLVGVDALDSGMKRVDPSMSCALICYQAGSFYVSFSNEVGELPDRSLFLYPLANIDARLSVVHFISDLEECHPGEIAEIVPCS